MVDHFFPLSLLSLEYSVCRWKNANSDWEAQGWIKIVSLDNFLKIEDVGELVVNIATKGSSRIICQPSVDSCVYCGEDGRDGCWGYMLRRLLSSTALAGETSIIIALNHVDSLDPLCFQVLHQFFYEIFIFYRVPNCYPPINERHWR